MAMLALALLAVASPRVAPGWAVLNDTDFPSNLPKQFHCPYCTPGEPFGPGASAEDCANKCEAMPGCAAIVWNGPGSKIHDGNCGFKCSAAGRILNRGESAVVVRAGTDSCHAPPDPPPPPPTPPTPQKPTAEDPDWAAAYAAGQLLYSGGLDPLMPYIGNGWVATHPVHPSADSTGVMYAAGVFNGVSVAAPCDQGYCQQPSRAAIPTYRVTLPGLDAPRTTGGRYALDLRDGVLMRRAAVGAVAVEERWYAHAVTKALLVHEIALRNTASSGRPVEVSLAAVVGRDSADIDFNATVTAPAAGDGGIRVICGRVKHMEMPSMPHTAVAVASNVPPAAVVVATGAKKTVYFVSAVATSLDPAAAGADPVATATAALDAALASPTALFGPHASAWQAKWEAGRIEVTGDLALAQAINSSMYFILSSTRPDVPFGVSPGGLASNGYHGHTFWDQETWVLPSLTLLHPELAKAGLQYRADRLAGAAAKARSQGYGGIMWPCESAFSGYEVQGNGGTPPYSQEGFYGILEIHFSSDVSLGAWQYWQATGDTAFLESAVEPMLRGVADFWTSRVEPAGGPEYHIHNVMGADEYHHPVNDSAYTNYGAVQSIRLAHAAAVATGRAPGANWSAVADRIVVPFNATGQFHPEWSGYTPGTEVKQADTILLGYPYMMNLSAEVRANDLRTYAPVTDSNGPAMTWSMFAVGWLDVGDTVQANSFFRRGYANSQPPFGVWTETPRGGTVNFITGAGGFLQSVLFGFGGLRIRAGRLELAPPAPPAGAETLALRGVHYRGHMVAIVITNSSLSVAATATGAGRTKAPPLQLVAVQSGTATALGSTPVTRPRAARYYVVAPAAQK